MEIFISPNSYFAINIAIIFNLTISGNHCTTRRGHKTKRIFKREAEMMEEPRIEMVR